MNFGIIIKVLGSLLLFEAVALLPSLGISIYLGEPDTLAFIQSILLLIAFGFPMSKKKVSSKKIRPKEALMIVSFGWIFASIFGALPFVLSGSIPSFVDAFFETVSGLTTTGATLVNNVEIMPKGILFWRGFTNWLGGMGILVLTVAILPMIGVGGFQIFKVESPGPISDKLVPRIKDTAKILYTAYMAITIIQVVFLMFGGMNLFESLVHTFGTVGTGGFSTKNSSIAAFNSSYIEVVIAIFMIASGVNFALYYDVYKRRWRDIFSNSELKLYLFIVAASILFITLNLHGRIYSSITETFRHVLFQVGSIITTTGFSTVDYDQWTSFSKGILFILMFVGGCAGSTAGAIKNIRLLVLFKMIKRELGKVTHPRAVIPINIQGKTLSADVVASITSFFFLYIVIFLVGTLLISLEGVSLVSAASSVAATLGNIGPGFDFVGPTKTYSLFSAPSKLLLSMLMLLGRLELFSLLIIMTPNFWRQEM